MRRAESQKAGQCHSPTDSSAEQAGYANADLELISSQEMGLVCTLGVKKLPACQITSRQGLVSIRPVCRREARVRGTLADCKSIA